MRDIRVLIWCVVLTAALLNVEGSAIYRKYRELEVPVEKLQQHQQQETVQEFVGELQQKKEIIPVEVDVIEPVVILKEEVIIPVETSVHSAEPLLPEIENSIPITNEIVPKNIQEESPSENEVKDDIEKVQQPQNLLVIQTENSESSQLAEQNDDQPELILKQGVNSTSRPTLLQQAQQSFGQFIDTIRRPLTPQGSTPVQEVISGVGSVVDSSTNPNIFQQLQSSVQNLGSQISSAFLPNQQNFDSASTPRPPNILDNLQSNIQNVVNNVFRPQTESTVAGANPTPVGPLQAVLSNVQSFFAGNRGGQQNTQQPQSNQSEVVVESSQPTDEVKNSEEIPEPVETTQEDIVVGEPDDSSE